MKIKYFKLYFFFFNNNRLFKLFLKKIESYMRRVYLNILKNLC